MGTAMGYSAQNYLTQCVVFGIEAFINKHRQKSG